ncbi:MAG TPA: immunoglobulin domain-containing protein [Candidatus Acidoferrum sp.]|nr:immunoglobulin domain-containing protein [Candidatus Acidoferrum sp.]
MSRKISQLFRLPALLLAAALQIMPIARAALPAAQATADVLAIVFRWAAGAAAALGGVQAVSGASTVVTSPLSTNIVQGQLFVLRLTTAPQQAGYWAATGLPSGISLVGTNGRSFWELYGTPTGTGTYIVGLTAKSSANAGPSETTTANLTINISPGATNTPPAITTQPASLTVTQAQSATFTVIATGTAPLTYFWRKGGIPMTNGPNPSLTMANVQPTNAGTYSVIVSNSAGTVTSSNATLTVIVPPAAPAIATQPASQLVNLGQSATFNVVATGSAPLSYLWRKGTTVVTNSASASFTIASVQTADAGTYSVIVSNNLGSVTSSNATLTVNTVIVAPGITTQPTNQLVYQGDNALLAVVASGTAPFGFQWRKDGFPLADSARLSGTQTNLLTITGVSSNDAGGYTVVITNSSGSVTSQVARLTVTNATVWTLTVQIVGNGTVSPNYNGQALTIGNTYTMTASAAGGNVFSKWSGGIYSTAPSLTFVMQKALVLQANFAPSPFVDLAGTYHGLFYNSNSLFSPGSGCITIHLATSSSFTGSLQIGKSKWNFAGQFDANGNALVTVNRGKMPPVNLALQLDLPGSSDQITGTAAAADSSWAADLLAESAAEFNAKTNPCPTAGTYTLVIPGTPGATQSPAGDGYAMVKVTPAGKTVITGVLADGASFSGSGVLSQSGRWPLYASLYSGRGCLLGWLSFTNKPGSDLEGVLGWIRPVQPSVALYTMGFAAVTEAVGSRYTKPPTGTPVLNFANGALVLSDGHLAGSFTNRFQLNPNNKVVNLSANALQISFNAGNGRFGGKVQDPATGKSLAVKGIVLQKQNTGGGFFLNQNQSGEVYLEGTSSGGTGGGNGGGGGGD